MDSGHLDLESSLVDLLGYVAGLLTTVAYLPQVLQVWRTGSTRDISLQTYLVLVAGVGLWCVYGIVVGELPIMLANGLTLLLAGTILVLKLKNG